MKIYKMWQKIIFITRFSLNKLCQRLLIQFQHSISQILIRKNSQIIFVFIQLTSFGVFKQHVPKMNAIGFGYAQSHFAC